MIATTTEQVKLPLKIRFLDPVQPLKVGREIRFDVEKGAEGGAERIPIEHLDFSFAPIRWGVVRASADPAVGIVEVVALAKPRDIYDRPRYEILATLKAAGEGELETVNRFAMALALPVVELRFFLLGDGSFEPFHPQEQPRPLDILADFEVSPPGSAELFERDGRILLRLLAPSARPRVRVRFPNGETASLDIDLGRAGADPALEREPVWSLPPQRAVAPEREALPTSAAVTRPSSAAVPVAVPEREVVSASAPVTRTPSAPVAAAAPPPAAPALRVDPSASLRREVLEIKREIDATLATGPLKTQQRTQLQRRLDFIRGAVQAYKGPDVPILREFYERTLGEVSLPG